MYRILKNSEFQSAGFSRVYCISTTKINSSQSAGRNILALLVFEMTVFNIKHSHKLDTENTGFVYNILHYIILYDTIQYNII
jgi:hypothetical protein